MTDLPILFNAPMVCAVLDGRKTMTRWVLKPQPEQGARFSGIERDGSWLFTKGFLYEKMPARYAVGDRLWVREAWACYWPTDDQRPSEIDHEVWSIRYYADDFARPAAADGSVGHLDGFHRKRPSIHMPRWASRLTLTVTDVRVERLQDISEADCIAEGCPVSTIPGTIGHPLCPVGFNEMGTPTYWYRQLWNKINGPDAWAANPWVVAVSFTVAKHNIDQVPA